MVHRNTMWTTLEQWSPRTFLAAGTLFALPSAASGLNVVMGTEITVSPAVIFIFLLAGFIWLARAVSATCKTGRQSSEE
jgi:hypothetical protein